VKTLPRNTVLTGDAEVVLPQLLAESVDCAVTSPPYVGGVRDYGDPAQLGHEARVEGYVAGLREVIRKLRPVLKPHGSLWLNLGDAYARTAGRGVPRGSLFLAPQRLALALSADGWLVRNVCIWHKPNPLPQSARDRLSPTYEVVIFATKQRRYFFDLDAVRVPHRSVRQPSPSDAGRTYQGGNGGLARLKVTGRVGHPNGKNPGDVWTIPTARDRLGHEATFPEALVERPVLATCPERICVQCDRAWTRPVRLLTVHTNEGTRTTVRRVGKLARCDCFAPSRPGVVLDPFFGTGTVGVVAERLGRDWLGIELNPAYAALAERRINGARRAA
jgi:site-specific DNA-methyltransferase (adenine-specific)